MEAKTNYTVVGLFVIIMGCGALSAALWLSIGFQQKTYHPYAVYMNEAVSGLSVQSAVKFNGVSVGYVQSINLNHDDPQQVELILSIEEGTPVTVSTTAKLLAQGITGITYIGLSASTNNEEMLQKRPGQPYPIIPAKPSLLVQLDAAVRDASLNLKDITSAVKSVLSEENARALYRVMNHLDTFTSMLAKRSHSLNSAIKDVNLMLANGANASKQLPDIMQKIKNSTDNFDTLSRELGVAAREGTTFMRTGRQAISKISNEAVSPAVTLLQKMQEVADNMDSLVKELRRHPSMVIRGKSVRRLGPGERQ